MRTSRIYRAKEKQLKLGNLKPAVKDDEYGEITMLRSEAAKLREILAE